MNDSECVQFLQWALPQLNMRWAGFRRVRNQVCKRLQKRLIELGIETLADYRVVLTTTREEWPVLDTLCQVTISRFYRDKSVFEFLREQVFPYLLGNMTDKSATQLRIWSAGCGSGEEPYSLSLLWNQCFAAHYPQTHFSIVATEINAQLLDRAKQASYPYSAIKNLPEDWRESAFAAQDDTYRLRPEHKQNIEFLHQDLRHESPAETGSPAFDLVCCRNLAFTYYDDALQLQIAQRIHRNLTDSGVLLLGVHETLPANCTGYEAWLQRLGIYLKAGARQTG